MNEKITQLIGKVKLGAKRNAPELLLGLGLVTGTASLVMTNRAAKKSLVLKSKLEVEKADMELQLNTGALTEEDAALELKQKYTKYALDLAKEYAVPAGLYAATVASVFSAYKIQKNRQLALSAALAACTTAYTSLVAKLKNGAEAGLSAQEVLDGVEVTKHIDEDGVVTYEKTQGEPIDSLYKVRFDKYSPCWEKDKFQNEATLRSEENWANDVLRVQGYLFLNDVYDRLGLPRTKAGQIVGWVLDGEGDGFVDFGLTDCETYNDVRFDSNAFDLNFNVDGDILSKF